jgi:hypothetical protein
VDEIASVAAGLVDGLGDGAVPLESTKIEGVKDHVMVDGNHSSMLHKTGGDKAALNVVLKRLKE